jgi:glucose/arabinose dehydrogenase
VQRFDLWTTLLFRFGSLLVALTLLSGCTRANTVEAAAAQLPPRPLTPPSGSGRVPDGFTLELVTKVESPTAVAFTPEGHMLITTQPGRLFVWDGVSLSMALDLSHSTCSEIERGLLGVAVDPDFSQNRSIYLFYTADRGEGCANRVSKLTLIGGKAQNEVSLIDGIPSPKGNHNAGDLNFGPDGHLYVSTGDGGCDYAGRGCDGRNDASRDAHVLSGKILRITTDGAAVPDNPFTGPDGDTCRTGGRTTPGRRCRETFAEGLRNPYRFAFDPNRPGSFYVNDVGQERWEEINEGTAGADYGWNLREGRCDIDSVTDCSAPPAGFTDPIFDYSTYRPGGCHAITGGAFVPPGVWPEPYGGDYLFGDFGCGAIFHLVDDGSGELKAELFAAGFADWGVVHLEFGPFGDTQALYFTTYEGGGAVYRIGYGA